MVLKKLVVDDKILVAFQERYEIGSGPWPKYISDILNKRLLGVKIENATKEEFLKYKRTRKKKLTSPIQGVLI